MGPVVIKIGGEIVADEARMGVVVDELVWLHGQGHRVVLCHGGGPQTRALGERLGVAQKKVAGQRVTDSETLEVVTMVLAGTANVSVVTAARARGLPVVGLDGVSAGLIGHRRPPMEIDGELVDYGLVGDLDGIEGTLIGELVEAGRIPIIGGLCFEPVSGNTLNVNADDVASTVAVALAAQHLVLVTGVDGVMRDLADPGSRIETITHDQFETLRASGAIVDGMVAKLRSALETRARGVGHVHIVAAQPRFARAALGAPGSRGTVVL